MIPILQSKSRVYEVHALVTNMIRAFEASSLHSEKNLSQMFAELQPLYQLFSEAIKPNRTKSNLKALNKARRYYYQSFHYLVHGLVKHPTPEIQTAARSIALLLKPYGLKLTEQNYATQSSGINSLLLKLSKPQVRKTLDHIPASHDLIGALSKAQKDFQDGRLALAEGKSMEKHLEKASALKLKIIRLTNKKIVAYLNVMWQMDEDKYGALSRYYVEVIGELNTALKRRQSRKKSNSKPVKLMEPHPGESNEQNLSSNNSAEISWVQR